MPTKFDIQSTFLQVYPAALRAQKRRQQEIKKKAQLREEAVKKKEVPSHFDVDVAFPKTWWMTEYQRNFCKEEDVKRHFLRQHTVHLLGVLESVFFLDKTDCYLSF